MIGWLLFGPNHEKLSCLDAPTAAPRGAPDPSFQLSPFSVYVFHHLIEQGVPLKFQRGTVPFEHGLLRGPSPRFASGPSSLFFWRHHPGATRTTRTSAVRTRSIPPVALPSSHIAAATQISSPTAQCDKLSARRAPLRRARACRPHRARVPLIVAQKCADGLDDRAVFAAPLLGQAFYFPGRKNRPTSPRTPSDSGARQRTIRAPRGWVDNAC